MWPEYTAVPFFYTCSLGIKQSGRCGLHSQVLESEITELHCVIHTIYDVSSEVHEVVFLLCLFFFFGCHIIPVILKYSFLYSNWILFVRPLHKCRIVFVQGSAGSGWARPALILTDQD